MVNPYQSPRTANPPQTKSPPNRSTRFPDKLACAAFPLGWLAVPAWYLYCLLRQGVSFAGIYVELAMVAVATLLAGSVIGVLLAGLFLLTLRLLRAIESRNND